MLHGVSGCVQRTSHLPLTSVCCAMERESWFLMLICSEHLRSQYHLRF